MTKSAKNDMLILLIVGVVALVGVGVLLFNAATDSVDLTGQGTSATRTRATCADNDGGSDSQEYTLGITTGTAYDGRKSTTVTDSCNGLIAVKEGYCVNSGGSVESSYTGQTGAITGAYVSSQIINCEEGYCDDGVCNTGCYENDDGQTYTTNGYVVDDGTVYSDDCVDGSTVTEYYCSSGQKRSTTKTCSDVDEDYICSDGACVPDTCTDTDGGSITDTSGVVTTLSGIEQYDWCDEDGVTLTEFTCSGANVRHELIDCSESGQVCSNGACVTLDPACSDSDGGRDYNEKGTTTGYEIVEAEHGYEYSYTASETDSCSTSSTLPNKLLEYTCGYLTEMPEQSGYLCTDEDKICSDGACVECTQTDTSMCDAGYKCSRRGACYTTCDSASAGANECRIRDGYQCTDDVTGTNGCYLECDSAADCLSGYRCSGGWCVETPS